MVRLYFHWPIYFKKNNGHCSLVSGCVMTLGPQTTAFGWTGGWRLWSDSLAAPCNGDCTCGVSVTSPQTPGCLVIRIDGARDADLCLRRSVVARGAIP